MGCTSKPKGVYVGDLSDGKRSGKGTVKYRNGDKYQGQFFQDKKHGQGTHTWRDGKKYVGEWKEGKRDGIGKMSYKDGTFFNGEWKRDYPLNGKGVYQGTYRGSKINTWWDLLV